MAASSSLDNLVRFKHHLHVLRDSSPKVQKALLKHADENLVRVLIELCLNILNGNLALTDQSRQVLARYKSILRELVYAHKPSSSSSSSSRATVRRNSNPRQRGRGGGSSSSSGGKGGKEEPWVRKKRNYLVQKGCGAFLTTLITSALGGIVGKIISNSLSNPEKTTVKHK